MRRGRLGVIAVAVVALTVVSPAAPQGLAKQLVVDKDKVQCPKAGFTSIQAAVNAANPGDTITVCPDLYTESVTVNKPGLTLVGASNVGDCTVVTAADPTTDSIVTGVGFSFSLTNYSITLSGFVVQGSTNGILTSDAFSGYRITNDTVQNNLGAGVNLNSGGTNQTRVDHNCFRTNGSAGLQSEVGNLKNALVDHNSTYRNGFSGFDFSGVGSRQYVTVTRNSSVQDGAGYSMTNSIGSSIDHNDASGVGGSGVLIGGANNGLNISYNDLEGGANGIRFNQNLFFPIFAAPSVGLNVSDNTVSGASGSGIVAEGPTSLNTGSVNLSVFSNNNSSLNGLNGIRLEAFNTGNQIANNTTNQNNTNGIWANGATGNTFQSNHMNLNVGFDALDDNRPANTWTGNHCVTDFPAGTICGV
jgi:hypothetical protein